MSSIDEILALCETRIGYQFRDRTLLRRCLTHSSSAETRLDSNERLEFLGDAVLGLIICEHLFRLYPQQREGQLTQMKSCLVSRQTCARVARLLELQSLILVGRGLQSIPDSILSAVIESLIAGVYFDGGIEAAREFILFGFREELALCGPVDTENYKSQLQEHTQRELGKTPEYLVVEETGPDHAREFGVAARVGVMVFDIGRGRSKKEAEQQAARNAVMSLAQARSLETLQTQSDVQLDATCDGSVFVSLVDASVGNEDNFAEGISLPDLELVGEGIGEPPAQCETSGECCETAVAQETIDVSGSAEISIAPSPGEYFRVADQNSLNSAIVNSPIVVAENAQIACDASSMKECAMQTVKTEILFRPESPELRFLPEGPYSLDKGRMSWVGIQHGAHSTKGSINILDLAAGTNISFELPGRPGFAFPTDRPGVFVTGVERSVGLFDTNNGKWSPFIQDVDSDVSNTIINDAVVFEGHLIFGCKELEFKTKKAGLYLWRRTDGATIRLRNDQICSNGKAVVRDSDGTLTLFDIDSPSKQIVRSTLSIEDGTVGDPQVVVDLSSEEVFPDGMILTPDHKSLIVALYDPGDPDAGAARQYSLANGKLEAVWTCPRSPRVTCPQLIDHGGRVRLILTSAVEHMQAEQLEKHPDAGCLFVGDTSFTSLGDQPIFACP